MDELIIKALQIAGYDLEPTVDNLKQCFLAYVACVGEDGELAEAEEQIADGFITAKDMALALIQVH